MKRFLPVTVLLFLAVGALPASADTLFFENFDSENGGIWALDYASFAEFDIISGTVDLIGNGSPYDFLPGNGLYVDLDGSTQNAGLMLATPIALTTPGDYVLSFDLAGNQRGYANDTVEVDIRLDGGPFYWAAYGTQSAMPFNTNEVHFSLSGPANLTFSFHNQGGDNVGALLDNVKLTGPAAVPDGGATLMLLGAALAGLGWAGRRWRR